MSDYNTKLAIEDWKSNGENGIEINRLYYMKFDHEVENINEKLNDTRFMTGFSYTKIDTTFQELVNDLATLNAYIVKVLDEIDEKIDEPYYQELNRGVLEDLERIKLEDFTIPNNLGITEEKYITVNDPTAQYGVTTTKVRTEKKELTLEDMLNNYEMDGTQGFKTFTDMYRDQFKSMQQATNEMKDLDFNDYVNAVIHQADYQHTVDAGWLNTLGDVLDVVGITSIIGSFTGTNVFTGEILTDSERSAAIFSAVINVGLLVLTVATAGVGSVVAAGVKVTASAIAKQVAKSLIIDMVAGIGGMAATHVLQSIGAPPWLAAVVGIGVSFAGGFSGQKVLDAVTSKQAVNSLLGQGIRNVDDLLASGRSIDDLLKAGIKPKALVDLGITSADDLARLGINSVDDLKRLGFTMKKLKLFGADNINDLAKLGINNTDDFVKAGLGNLDDAKRLFNGAGSKLNYKTTSGLTLEVTPGKTTTVLGTYKDDTGAIIDELGNIKSTDFGPRDGGFNLLNTPDELYVTPEQFWREYNQPWLDKAIERGDIIKIATEPTNSTLRRINNVTGEVELTGFGKEYYYLIENNYVYDPLTKSMVQQ
ncbi:hypothetical protein HCJ32_10310 [Listeria booriae]|uniref:hypothetical protein n=1 Tax=Listeria booriae TaxID=1552123 RepID=UPI00162AE7FB|nr:hypothetical protein [Listeria booriae]MBC1945358.1 hypothetical protein [Listeria booriae]